jgi:hypothetical protein
MQLDEMEQGGILAYGMTYGLTQISFSATIYQKVDPFENIVAKTSSVVDPDPDLHRSAP